MKVSEVMSADVRTAAPDSTLETIAKIMQEEDVGAVPVWDKEELIGIITDRDIVIRCVAQGTDPGELTADEIIEGEVMTIASEAEVEEAAGLMAQYQIRRLPVVEDGKLVGMVSLGDLAVKSDQHQQVTEALKEISAGVKGNGGRRAQKRSGAGDARSNPTLVERTNRNSSMEDWEQRRTSEGEQDEEDDLVSERLSLDASDGRHKATRSARGRQSGSARGRDSGESRVQSGTARGRGNEAEGRDTRETAIKERNTGKQNARKHREMISPRGESSRSEPASLSGRGQGVSNRSAGEERKRKQRVISMRSDAKAGSSKRRKAS